MIYADDVSPAAAWSALTDGPRSVLVDVRILAEWSYVGARSIAAAEAATRAGRAQAYNVLDGFDGPHNPQRHRAVCGWKVDGLPWVQG